MKTLNQPDNPASKESFRLTYDHESGRWCIGRRELHCGDCFDLYADDPALPPIPVRIEMADNKWYLDTPYGFMQPSGRRVSL